MTNAWTELLWQDKIHGPTSDQSMVIPLHGKEFQELPLDSKMEPMPVEEYFKSYVFSSPSSRQAILHSLELLAPSTFESVESRLGEPPSIYKDSHIHFFESLVEDFLSLTLPSQLLLANHSPVRISLLYALAKTSAFWRDTLFYETSGSTYLSLYMLRHRDSRSPNFPLQILNYIFDQLIPGFSPPSIPLQVDRKLTSEENISRNRDIYLSQLLKENRNRLDAALPLWVRELGKFVGRNWAMGGTPKGGAVAPRNIGFLDHGKEVGQLVIHDHDGGYVPKPDQTQPHLHKLFESFEMDAKQIKTSLSLLIQALGFPNPTRENVVTLFNKSAKDEMSIVSDTLWQDETVMNRPYKEQFLSQINQSDHRFKKSLNGIDHPPPSSPQTRQKTSLPHVVHHRRSHVLT